MRVSTPRPPRPAAIISLIFFAFACNEEGSAGGDPDVTTGDARQMDATRDPAFDRDVGDGGASDGAPDNALDPEEVPDLPAEEVVDLPPETIEEDLSLDAPADAPADAPVDAPSDELVDAPIDEIVDLPLEAVDAPVDAIDVPADAIDAPVDAVDAADAPIDTADATPDAAVDATRDADTTLDGPGDSADATGDVSSDAGAGDPDIDPASAPDVIGLADTIDVEEEEAAPEPLPDLIVYVLSGQVFLDEASFDSDSCPVVEGCILGIGSGEIETRRLLRFSIATANIGTADLVLGPPAGNPLFEFSPCHNHYHFESFAAYELRNAADEVVAVGHKQAFCLFDNGIYLTDDDTVNPNPQFSCNNQGIQRGWFDRYGADLDCQWIDVTDLPAGEYVIHVSINEERILEESNYTNNTASFPVTIEDPALDDACPFGSPDGPNRQCDWDNRGTQTCTPGTAVRLGCNAEAGCNLGSSVGDPMLRVCAGDDASCFGGIALATSNDTCGGLGPYAEFTCPDEGEFTIWTAPYAVAAGYSCTLGREDGAATPVSDACPGDPPEGPGRNCGWDVAVDGESCFAGFEYWLGCNAEYCAIDFECTSGPEVCGVGPVSCEGEPMLRVCGGDDRCLRGLALAENDGACDGPCPEVRFVCPAEGAYTLLTTSALGEAYSCDFDSARIIDLNPE